MAVVLTALCLFGPGCSDDDPSADVDRDGGEPPSDVELVAAFDHEADYETVDPTNCPLRGVAFTDTSTGEPESWSWDFGDGTTSTEQNPTVTPDALFMEVTLTVTRGDEEDSTTEELTFSVC